jgi:tRNA A-37 threonylcarbamoyl transferase component Bud32
MEAFNDYTYRFLETIEKLELTDYKVWNTLENLSKATMSKIRRGICGVSMNTLQEFCQTYQVNANYILTGKGPMFIDEDSGSSQQDTDSMSLSYDELSRLYETTVSRYERLFGKLEKQFNELEQTITKARNELEQALLDVKNVLEEKKTA